MKIICLFLISSFSVCLSEDNPIVNTPLGKVKGFRQKSHGGRAFSAFEGVPYAKPPVGDRRFETPEPVEPWQGTWDARHPTICAQVNTLLEVKKMEGIEDCLHLNIYVPRDEPNSKDDLDVIVHIHGGGYIFGHGNDYCRPRFLMDHEVIFVTFNYRLGILGFLSTEDDVVSGNMGLKDQVLLLKWIQDNIKSFGGNPNSVTLTGMSAGASSTHLHYFSEMSKNLFHRGVAHSGMALNSWSLQENSLQNAKKLASALGCPLSSNEIMIDCLKQRPYGQLLNKTTLFLEYMILPFVPVVEKGSKPFLKDFPYNLLITKKILDLPLIVSHTPHEGLTFAQGFWRHLETVNKNWTQLAPFLLLFDKTLPSSKWANVSQKIKNQYFGQGQDINKENFMNFSKLFGDRYFHVDGENAVLWQAAANMSPVYYYRFSYPGDGNEQKFVKHGGEEKYFFGPKTSDERDLTINELKMKDVMVQMLVTYAKTGVPNLKGVNWQPTNPAEPTYLSINGFEDGDIEPRRLNDEAVREFWKSLGFSENENLVARKDNLK